MRSPLKLLFLCTGNSCRSQMAEAWARELCGDRFEVFSAGLEPQGIDPRAAAVMREAGIDISAARSKHVEELARVSFDHVITVCDRAGERCPVFGGQARVTHVGFDDPPCLARSARSEEQALSHYRRVRDEIREFVEKLPELLEKEGESR